jgi:hypothetical protein
VSPAQPPARIPFPRSRFALFPAMLFASLAPA